MRRAVLLALAVLAFAGCGGGASVVQAGSRAEGKPGAEVVGEARVPEGWPTLGPCEIYGGTTKPPVAVPDPDCGLTDEEKHAKHTAASNAFFTRLGEWFKSDYVRGLDPKPLPRYDSLGGHTPGEPSLAKAVRKADLAVLGTVTAARFVHGHLVSSFRVERIAKGRAPELVTVRQDHGVRPEEGFTSASMIVEPNAPVLLPGDRAVLLLTEEKDGYGIGVYSGAYASSGGKVRATEGNSFRGEVDGLTEDELMDRIEALA